MSDLYLLLEPTCGSTIKSCCEEAVSTANHLRLTVRFVFNEVTVIARPNADPSKLVEAFHNALKRANPVMVAVV